MNLIAEDGDREEDEDGDEGEDEDEGWWVGTVGVMEVPDWAGEIPHSMPSSEQEQENGLGKAESSSQVKDRPEHPLSDCSADETAEGEWWDLESTYSSLGRGGAGARRPRAPKHPSGSAAWTPY